MTDKAAVTYVDERGNEYLALVTRVDPVEVEGSNPTLSVAFANIDGIEDMHGTALSKRSGVPHKSDVPAVPAPDSDEAVGFQPAAYWKDRRTV